MLGQRHVYYWQIANIVYCYVVTVVCLDVEISPGFGYLHLSAWPWTTIDLSVEH